MDLSLDAPFAVRPAAVGAARLSPNVRRIELLPPRSLAAILDESFDLYKRRFVTLLLIVGVVYIPTQVAMHAAAALWLQPTINRVSGAGRDPDLSAAFSGFAGALLIGWPRAGVPGLLSMAALIIASAPVTVAVSDAYLGRRATLRSLYGQTVRQWPALLTAWSFGALAFIGTMLFASVVISILFFILGIATRWILSDVLGSVFLVAELIGPYLAGCVIVALWFCFTGPLLILEKQPVAALPSRHTQLAGNRRFSGRWLATVGVPLMTLGLQALILLSGQSLLEILQLSPTGRFLTELLLSTGLTLLLQPFWMVFFTLYYYEYRVRVEGLDIYLMAASWPHLKDPRLDRLQVPTPFVGTHAAYAQAPSEPAFISVGMPAPPGGRFAPSRPIVPSLPGNIQAGVPGDVSGARPVVPPLPTVARAVPDSVAAQTHPTLSPVLFSESNAQPGSEPRSEADSE